MKRDTSSSPPTIRRKADAMCSVSTLRSAARLRSITTRNSGLSSLSVVSASMIPSLLRANTQLLGIIRQRFEIRTAQHEIDVPIAAADVKRRQVAHGSPEIGEFTQAGANLLHHVAL